MRCLMENIKEYQNHISIKHGLKVMNHKLKSLRNLEEQNHIIKQLHKEMN